MWSKLWPAFSNPTRKCYHDPPDVELRVFIAAGLKCRPGSSAPKMELRPILGIQTVSGGGSDDVHRRLEYAC